jgi:hypothetical protein
MHSREEDESGVKVYRPAEYTFPRARGRTGFEIRANGEFVHVGIAPTDGLSEVVGRWSSAGPGRISVDLGERGAMLIEIMTCESGLLKVRV